MELPYTFSLLVAWENKATLVMTAQGIFSRLANKDLRGESECVGWPEEHTFVSFFSLVFKSLTTSAPYISYRLYCGCAPGRWKLAPKSSFLPRRQGDC